MVTGRRIEVANAVFNRTSFWVGRSKIEALDSRKGDRCSAHRTRLQRDMELAIGQSLRPNRGRRLTDCQDFGMRRRVAKFQRPVAGGCNDLTIAYDHRPDRNFATICGGSGLGQSAIHWR